MGSKNPKLDIYWNLHQDCWSIRDRGIVSLHYPALIAEDVKLVVQPAGRERVRLTGKKNVHAFARASSIILNHPGIIRIPIGYTRIKYNPYKCETFVDEEGNPVCFVDKLFMQDNGMCYAKVRK